MEVKIKEYLESVQRTKELYKELLDTKDGFIYITKGEIFKERVIKNFNNNFALREYSNCKAGLIDIYTNNPDINMKGCTYNKIHFINKDDIKGDVVKLDIGEVQYVE